MSQHSPNDKHNKADTKELGNKANSGPKWHEVERPDKPLMDEKNFPEESEYYQESNNHAVPSLLTYTGKAGPLDDPAHDPPLLEQLLLDIDSNALEGLRAIEKMNMAAVGMATKAMTGEDLPEGVTVKDAMTIGDRAGRCLTRVIVQKRDIAIEAAQNAAALDERLAFVEDRSVAVVKQTLLALDNKFIKVGFGAWMPFRYPDQWLMFCGVLTRVLAANGLIHSDNPDAYRKILEETPPVPKGEDSLKAPQKWGACWANRGSQSIRELRFKLGLQVDSGEQLTKPKLL